MSSIVHSIDPRTANRAAWLAEARASLALGWPLILTNLAQAALTATDVIFMGRLGPEALAAGSLAATLYQSLMLFGIGLITATMPLLASALGRNRHAVRDLRRTVQQGWWSAALVCVPMWALMWHTEPLLVALGQEPALAAKAASFMRTLQWSLLPYLCFSVLRSFFAVMDKPLSTLVIVVLAIAFNAGAAWCLMFGHLGLPALGLPGAGISSTASSLFMFVALGAVLVRHRRFRRYRLFSGFWRPDVERLLELSRLGLPIAFAIVFETLIFYAAVLMMGMLGTVPLAAHAIAMQITVTSFMVPLSMGQVATIRVGRALGAGDAAGVKRAGWTAWALGVGFMACMAIVLLTIPQALIGLFLDLDLPSNRPVAELTVTLLACAALFQIADGAQAVGSGMLRGLHDTRVPMLLAGFGYWCVGTPLSALLGFGLGWGSVGIWIGLAIGLMVVASLFTRRWMQRDRLVQMSGA
ncbi:MAG: multi anti extrusion protein MatE [Rhizobacter sp.]|nr:multi anti extrusion protein MatE [Rhizobacter sp.]